MPLARAHQLVPEAHFLDYDPAADSAAMEAVLDRLAAFSPGIAAVTDPTDPRFGHVEVQVDGLEVLWGPEPQLVERIVAALASLLPGPPRAGIAGTRFAAAVAAVVARRLEPVIVSPGSEAAFLAPYPSTLLTRDPEIRARLLRFGLRRIGAVAALPRAALRTRLGPEGERIAARARGEETDPFRPTHRPERLRLALVSEAPLTSLEPLRFLLHRLATALSGQLAGRGLAAGGAILRLELEGAEGAGSGGPPGLPSEKGRGRVGWEVGDPEVDDSQEKIPRGSRTPARSLVWVVEQGFPEPTWEAEGLERLLLVRLEEAPPPGPVTRLELELTHLAPASGEQLNLWAPRGTHGGRLPWQLARLALRFGPERILRPVIVDPDAPLPERQIHWEPATAAGEAATSRGSASSPALAVNGVADVRDVADVRGVAGEPVARVVDGMQVVDGAVRQRRHGRAGRSGGGW